MRIVILETGIPPNNLAGSFGTYGQMFRRMLAPLMPDLQMHAVAVYEGAPLPELAMADGYIISGSPKGVYEADDWIAPLEAFVRAALETCVPVVGICFGHQLMAQALGGQVVPSTNGWGVGVHEYTLTASAPIAATTVSCVVSHKDQVVAMPQGGQVLGGSEFCPHGIIAYAQGPGLSFQMHPEFEHDFTNALLNVRAEVIGPDLVGPAQASLAAPSRRDLLISWIVDFFNQHKKYKGEAP